MTTTDPRIDEVLTFWFGATADELPAHSQRWFRKDPAFDDEIRRLFAADHERAARGELDGWSRGTARGALALVVLLDQMSRNMFRDSAGAFASDARALAVCRDGRASGLDRTLGFVERYVFYMPLMHAEDRAVQKDSVATFTALAAEAEGAVAPPSIVAMLRSAREYAEKHAAIVERFGRYPHRNALLARPSTPDEVAFLEQPGSSF